ncbi:MAG: hypothetical protein ABI862_17215 [Ilumatobacteraceae bacterium]
MRVLAALAIATAALVAAPLASVRPAAASCAAPTVTFKPAKVARGATLTVTGRYFGDDCLDTGTLPPGVGALGTPLTGLTLAIDQGDNEFIVATGSADGDYEFQVDVVVPTALEPGEAILSVLGAGDARLTISPPIVISSAPVKAAGVTVATFGPEPPPNTVPSGTDPPSVLPAEIPDEPAATTPTVSTVPVEANRHNRDLQIAIGVGVAGIVVIGITAFAVWGRSRRRS